MKINYNGMEWYIPHIHTGKKEVQFIICRKVSVEEYRKFYEEYKNIEEMDISEEEIIRITEKNPFSFSPNFRAVINKKELESGEYRAYCYVPFEEKDMKKEKKLVETYKLDSECAWQIFDYKAEHEDGIKEIESIELAFSLGPQEVELGEFEVVPGDDNTNVEFINPLDEKVYNLKVHSVEQCELKEETFGKMKDNNYIYPRKYIGMKYSVEPEINIFSEDIHFVVKDCGSADAPIQKQGKVHGASAVAVFGGIRKSTEDESLRSVCSNLHFEEIDKVKWKISLYYSKSKEEVFKLR